MDFFMDCPELSMDFYRILEWVAVSYSRESFPTQGSNMFLVSLAHSPPKCPSHPGCHIMLSRVPCAIQ